MDRSAADSCAKRMGARRVLRLGDFAALDAACANAQSLGRSVHNRFHCLQVHVPAPPGNVVRVRDVIAKTRPFAADIASLCHGPTPDIPMISGSGKASETHSASGAATMPNLQYSSVGGRFRVSYAAAPPLLRSRLRLRRRAGSDRVETYFAGGGAAAGGAPPAGGAGGGPPCWGRTKSSGIEWPRWHVPHVTVIPIESGSSALALLM
jgi:hypothetical protein